MSDMKLPDELVERAVKAYESARPDYLAKTADARRIRMRAALEAVLSEGGEVVETEPDELSGEPILRRDGHKPGRYLVIPLESKE